MRADMIAPDDLKAWAESELELAESTAQKHHRTTSFDSSLRSKWLGRAEMARDIVARVESGSNFEDQGPKIGCRRCGTPNRDTMSSDDRNARELIRTDAVALAIRFHADVQKTPMIVPKREDAVINEASFPTSLELLVTADAFDHFIVTGKMPEQGLPKL